MTDVGTPFGTPVTATIGSGGGTVASVDNRIQLSIPAGALPADTAITIQPVSNESPGGLGYAFRLTPNGQTFTKPVTLTYTPVENDLDATTPAAVGLAFQTAADTWQVVPGTHYDSASNTFTTTTTHFTDYSYYSSFKLFSQSPFGILSKDTTQLSVVQVLVDRCSGQSPDDCLSQPGDINTTAAAGITWAVNGQNGGDGTHGTVTTGQNPATYTAPATVPTDNVAAVSASLTPDGTTQLVLVKNLLVLAHKYHVDVLFEDKTTCDKLPSGGTPVFGYDVDTGGSFSVSFASNLNATVGDLVSSTNDAPLAGGAFAGCATGTSAAYNPGGTHGLELDGITVGLSSTTGRFNATITGAYSGGPAATLTFPGGKTQTINEDRSVGSIAGFQFKGAPKEQVVITAGNNINIFKKRTYTLSVLQQ